jgi:hypothetical protein
MREIPLKLGRFKRVCIVFSNLGIRDFRKNKTKRRKTVKNNWQVAYL